MPAAKQKRSPATPPKQSPQRQAKRSPTAAERAERGHALGVEAGCLSLVASRAVEAACAAASVPAAYVAQREKRDGAGGGHHVTLVARHEIKQLLESLPQPQQLGRTRSNSDPAVAPAVGLPGCAAELPALRPLDSLARDALRDAALAPRASWLVPGRVICCDRLTLAHPETLAPLLLHLGVDAGGGRKLVVCCMQTKVEHRDQVAYEGAVRKRVPGAKFILRGTPDKSVSADGDIAAVVDQLVRSVSAGACVVLHCRGGHGRTATVGALLIGRLYGLAGWEALRRCGASHDARAEPVFYAPDADIPPPEAARKMVQEHLALRQKCGTSCTDSLPQEQLRNAAFADRLTWTKGLAQFKAFPCLFSVQAAQVVRLLSPGAWPTEIEVAVERPKSADKKAKAGNWWALPGFESPPRSKREVQDRLLELAATCGCACAETAQLIPLGVGEAANGANRTRFVVLLCPAVDALRATLGLPPKDLHATLGFVEADIHGVCKGLGALAVAEGGPSHVPYADCLEAAAALASRHPGRDKLLRAALAGAAAQGDEGATSSASLELLLGVNERTELAEIEQLAQDAGEHPRKYRFLAYCFGKRKDYRSAHTALETGLELALTVKCKKKDRSAMQTQLKRLLAKHPNAAAPVPQPAQESPPAAYKHKKGNPQIVLLTGIPGSGKSTFAAGLARAGWHVISADELKSVKKGGRAFEEQVGAASKPTSLASRGVCIDRCNVTVEERADVMRLAHAPQPSDVAVVFFDTPIAHAKQMVARRQGHPTLKADNASSGKVVESFGRKLMAPSVAEGFGQVHVVADYEQSATVLQRLGGVQQSVDGAICKFPRTTHIFDASQGTTSAVTRDDLVMTAADAKAWIKDAVITVEEKVDGANLGISLDKDWGVFFQNRAHFVSSATASQWHGLDDWWKEHSAVLCSVLVPERHVLFGEWMAHKHSIFYTKLPGKFVAFDVYDRVAGAFLSRGSFHEFLEPTGLATVPILAQRTFGSPEEFRPFLDTVSQFGARRDERPDEDAVVEGVYLRKDSGRWLEARCKIVRADFVQAINEGSHWMTQEVVKNVITY